MAPFPRNNAMSHTPPYGTGDASYQAAGGIDGLRRLVDDFYRLMDERPEAAALRALHPADLNASRDKLACFLSGWLGGPPLYVERYGHPRLRARHLPFPIDTAAAEAWMRCMGRALDEVVEDTGLRRELYGSFARLADHMRNREG